MKLTDKTTAEEIIIYQSLWKNALWVAGCLAFSVIGCTIIRDNYCDLATKIIGGWLNIIFFGGCGLVLTVTILYNRIRHIPFLIIYEDRLELYEQRKRSYYSISFANVRKFRLVSLYSSKMISVDYKTIPLIHKVEESSDFKQRLMIFNFKNTGAVENILVANLTKKGKEICDLLNWRLKKYRMHKELYGQVLE